MWENPEQDRNVPYDDLRWSRFRNFEPNRMFQTVSQDAFSFIKHLNSGKESAYSRFMESAIFLIQSPRNLVKIVEGINSLDMNNRDTMGDVYEYILGKMAASGNNGQFRTPRHIIRMMVDMMKPTLDDTICDPAMGSAGFIVESAKYITEHYKTELMKKDRARHFRTTMLNGFDTDPKMLRIGAMNRMLHGVDSPTVEFRDSLSTDNTDENRYSLILANPPFSGIMWQELGTKEDYMNFLNSEDLTERCTDSVAAFIRTIIKVDRQKALQLFTRYISENSLTAEQEEYLKSILDYVCENGDMDTGVLVNEAPFDEINVLELFPGKLKEVADFVTALHKSITAA